MGCLGKSAETRERGETRQMCEGSDSPSDIRDHTMKPWYEGGGGKRAGRTTRSNTQVQVLWLAERLAAGARVGRKELGIVLVASLELLPAEPLVAKAYGMSGCRQSWARAITG